ncbi:MAG: GNAT family N-acetyltransferase [Ruminiclostridium sp.]|nr:GNAT family N-acetyltransferase [Ruminiclostridium sp.]
MIEYYSLYTSSFPDYPLSFEDFCSMTDIENSATVIEEKDGERLAGFAIIGKSNIPVIAVDKAYRNKGIGSVLLERAEEILRKRGVKEISLARGTNSIFQGVPMDNGNEDASEFFRKRGYKESHITYNMDIDTADFEYAHLNIPKPSNIEYRFAEESDKEELLKAVELVVPDWVDMYRECDDEILLAICDGRIAGFEMLNEYGGVFTKNAEKHGCIGCVGTVPEFRKRGIGLDMTARSVQILKDRGCDKVQLLYLVLDKWYGKLGFYITSTQWMGDKRI